MRISRRTFLFGCTAAAGGGLFLYEHSGIEGDAHASDPRAVSVGAMPADDAPALGFFALGDIGWRSPARARVVQRMIATAQGAAPDFVAFLGDNFYHDGIGSADDPRWQTDFEQSFPVEQLDVPFFAALGNHDHGGSIDAQVEYTKRSRRWNMPGRCYAFERTLGPSAERAAFFVLDTTPYQRFFNEEREQTAWLADALEHCTATWRIVIGHHPVLSHGVHGGIPQVASVLAPLFERHRVQLYFSGHDHDLQLVQSRAGWCQIVSGAGSSIRKTGSGRGTHFSLAQPGFTWVRLTAESAHVQFVSAKSGSCGTFRLDRRALAGEPLA